jgi:taurine dioxygenase
MANQASDSSITVTPLSPALGAEVKALDLSRPIDEATYRQVRDALLEHLILLFRDVEITPAQQIAFSRRFGDLSVHVVSDALLPRHPEILVVSNVKENGRPIGLHGSSRLFHSDVSYTDEPSMGSLFYCRECPPAGGETEFANMYAALEALPEERRGWLIRQRGVHDYIYHYEEYEQHREPLTDEQKAKVTPAVHPAVRTHPETGRKALFFSQSVTSHFESVDVAESRRVIKELTEFCAEPQFVYRHRWRPGDLIFWDNRCTMHRVLPWDDGHRRLMHRTTIKGDRPFL